MRNYNHIPRPEIEQHYHIRELIEGQEKRTADRVFYQNREKDRAERDNLIKDSKWMVVTDFYCSHCRRDFKAMAVKQVEVDWSNSTQNIAFYKTKCDEGHWCIRLITDRHIDGFWTRSKLVSLDRGNHFADTVQPHETNFNLLYGKK